MSNRYTFQLSAWPGQLREHVQAELADCMTMLLLLKDCVRVVDLRGRSTGSEPD